MTKCQKVPENRDQGIFLNGRVKKRIVAVFIVEEGAHVAHASLTAQVLMSDT